MPNTNFRDDDLSAAMYPAGLMACDFDDLSRHGCGFMEDTLNWRIDSRSADSRRGPKHDHTVHGDPNDGKNSITRSMLLVIL